MKKELTKQEPSDTTAVANQPYIADEWGDIGLESKDLVLPKILIQHATSDSVKAKLASEGDFLNTLTSENLGTAVELLPFFKKESIVVEKWNGKRFMFHTILPYEGKMPAWEEEIGGVRFKNSHNYEIFCLTKDMGLPHIISFKGTSNKIGKNLVTMMYASNPAQKLTPAGKWITYTTRQESNKDGDTYYVSAFAPTKLSTDVEISECKKWINVLKTASFSAAEEQLIVDGPIFTETKRF